jgi:glycosyltransferase involved in cell wall biosynthesis
MRPLNPDFDLLQIESYNGKKNEFALLIPVINEGKHIGAQLTGMSENKLVDIFIVDGGSTDSTLREIAKSRDLLTGMILMSGSKGLSHQLRVGFSHCLSLGYEYIITMDGNNKDDFSGVVQIQNALRAGNDFVQGSRFIKGGKSINTPIKRLLGIRFVHAPLTSLFARKKYTDTTNGFRGHSRNLLESIDYNRNIFLTYELLAYIPIIAGRLKLRSIEVPVTRAYPKGKIPTKIGSFRGELGLLVILIKAGLKRYDSQL